MFKIFQEEIPIISERSPARRWRHVLVSGKWTKNIYFPALLSYYPGKILLEKITIETLESHISRGSQISGPRSVPDSPSTKDNIVLYLCLLHKYCYKRKTEDTLDVWSVSKSNGVRVLREGILCKRNVFLCFCYLKYTYWSEINFALLCYQKAIDYC